MEDLETTENEIPHLKHSCNRQGITNTVLNIDGCLTNISYLHPKNGIDDEKVIIFIPGNPGAISFYDTFLEYLFEQYQVPIYGISHAGHDVLPEVVPEESESANETQEGRVPTGEQTTKNNIQIHSLEQQINYKLHFIRQYINPAKKIILVGHSLGCYISLRMLQELENTEQIYHVILLFPVFERTMETSGGKLWVPLTQFLEKPTTGISELMSISAKDRLIRFIASQRKCSAASTNSLVAGIRSLLSATGIKNMSKIANDLSKIGELGNLGEVINTYESKLTFYYGASDAWTPLSFYTEMREQFPDADIRLDNNNIQHAFVFNSSRLVAKIIAKIMTEKEKSLSDDCDQLATFQISRAHRYRRSLNRRNNKAGSF